MPDSDSIDHSFETGQFDQLSHELRSCSTSECLEFCGRLISKPNIEKDKLINTVLSVSQAVQDTWSEADRSEIDSKLNQLVEKNLSKKKKNTQFKITRLFRRVKHSKAHFPSHALQKTLLSLQNYNLGNTTKALLDSLPSGQAYRIAKESNMKPDLVNTFRLKLASPELEHIIDKAIAINQQEIELNACNESEFLALAPYLTRVDLRNDLFSDWDENKVSTFLNRCSSLNQLFIRSSRIRTLPALPNCKKLDCRNCYFLKSLPELPNCEKIDCSGCHMLKRLPELPNCKRLVCYSCLKLKRLPELPNCKELDCHSCYSLKSLPELPNCEKIDCSDCKMLESLPELPKCEKLICSDCHMLKSLPELPKCEKLICCGCYKLESLPNFPQEHPIQEIDCRFCPRLALIFSYPRSCRVFSGHDNRAENNADYSIVDVNVSREGLEDKEKLQRQLRSFAEKLSQVQKEKVRLFVHFKGREEATEAGIDYGGLAKEYLRLLIKGILDDDTALVPVYDSFLHCRLRVKHFEADKKNLKDLGTIIMAAGLSSNTRKPPWEDKLITGHFFHDSLLEQIKTFETDELLGDLENISKATREKLLVQLSQGMEPHEKVIKELVTDSFNPVSEVFDNLGFMDFEEEKPDSLEKWNDYRQKALQFLEENNFPLSVEGLHALGQGMISYFPTNNAEEKKAFWESWKATGTNELSENIQGRFDRNALAEMFEKDLQGSVAFKEKASFLARFVRDETIQDKEVKDFISFVTGAETLPPGVEIRLQQKSHGDPSPFPYAHACSNQLDIWHESIPPSEMIEFGDDTYENFVKTLKAAINSEGFGHI